jgi:hypothetical protein
MNKKILLIISVTLVIIGIGFLIYYKYYAKGTLEIKFQTPGVDITFDGKDYQNINSLKLNLKSGSYNFTVSKLGYLDNDDYVEIQKLKTTKIEIKLIKNVTISNYDNPSNTAGLIGVSSEGIYLLDYTNKQISTLNTGIEEKLMDLDFLNENTSINDCLWLNSNSGKIIGLMIKYLDHGSNVNFVKLVNLNDKKIFDLNSNISDISFNSENNKLAYIYQADTNNKNISISDIDGKNWKKILDVDLSASDIHWINNSTIIYLSESGDNKKILTANVNDNSKKEIIIKDIDKKSFLFKSQLSPNKQNILVPVFDGIRTELTVINLSTQNQQKLKDFDLYMNFYKWQDNNTIIFISSMSREQNDGLANFTINSLDVNSGKINTLLTFTGNDLNNVLDFFVMENENYIISTNQIMKLNNEN